MEKNNGRGIFYGVMGVATLVIAIIGATFAFFAASQNGTAFDATAANVALEFVEHPYMKSDLIPVETGYEKGTGLQYDEQQKKEVSVSIENQATVQTGFNAETAKTTFASSPNVGHDACNDGTYNICSIYDFTVTNPGSVEMPINVSFATTNTIANLKYAVFRGLATEITSWGVNGEPVDADEAEVGDLIIATTDVGTDFGGALDITLAADPKTTDATEDDANTDHIVSYTVIVWIEEVGMKQSASGAFNGAVSIQTGGGQGITGKLTTTGTGA